MLKMILADKALGWKGAMRKVLQMTFGQNTLAVSCAVGRKHSKNATLDQIKLNSIKGIIMSSCYMRTLSLYRISEMIYENFKGEPNTDDLKPETMNTLINSACCLAR